MCHKEAYWTPNQEPITRSVHLHCIHDPTYAHIELFLEMCCPRAVRIWPKSTLKKMAAKAKSRILRPFSSTVFVSFRVGCRSYADRRGDRRSRETILKIAQSGHRLSLRLSMGDGRSRWWAPANLFQQLLFRKRSVLLHAIGFFNLLDLWVIKMKKPMILCVCTTSRSREHSMKRKFWEICSAQRCVGLFFFLILLFGCWLA